MDDFIVNSTLIYFVLLPIDRAERVPQYSQPRGCVPPMAGQNRREQIGFRSSCLASARHLSPTPYRKTELQFRSRKLNHFPTRTHERTTASLCPAMGGTRPLGPSREPPPWQRAYRPMENRPNSPLDWEKTQLFKKDECRRPLGLIREQIQCQIWVNG